MARITIVTTAAEDRGLAYSCGQYNALHATEQDFVPLAPSAYLDLVVRGAITSYVRQADQADEAAVLATMSDPLRRAAIRAAAGLT